MTMPRLYNFNAGPAILPLEVLEQLQAGFMEFGGMSILEISHRSKEFDAIIDEARASIVDLMAIPADYEVLFLQGGASLQFAMIPLNFLATSADYVITGHWSKAALKEAKHIGATNVIYTAEEGGFKRTPRANEIIPTKGADYCHITTNNTIYGTEYRELPDTGSVPLIGDMSSDIMATAIDVKKFACIYAGAQKNLGPSGITVVVLRRDLIAKRARDLPTFLTYATHAEAKSLYNTPPVFSIWALMHVLRWVKKQGGVAAIEKTNREKAKVIYDVLDASTFYKGHADRDSRSLMNLTFTLPSEELTEKFVAEAKKRQMVGIKGHRSVGGIRASMYNAFPLEGARALATFMKEFERNA